MNLDLFQKKAVAKMKKPDQQDFLFQVVPPIGWIGLTTVVVVLFSVLIWAFFGVMSEKVSGYGMIINKEGIVAVAPSQSGRVTSMNFDVGAKVDIGDELAEIEQSQTNQQMRYQMERAGDATSGKELRNQLAEISSLKESKENDSIIKSKVHGVIVNTMANPGDVVSAGTPIYDIRVESGDNTLVAVVYVSVLDGNKIKPGMTLQLTPGIVDADEAGSLLTKVVSVSEVPVGTDRIFYWTGSKEFANMVTQKLDGAVLEVAVEMIEDAESPSGYLWTSIRGGEDPVKAGMVCTSTAIVKREPPIVKAFDKLGQWLRSN